MLKYSTYDVVFQEVPDEVSLAITITNCPHRCPGCHSPHLHADVGTPLTLSELQRLVGRYQDNVTCVCIMGGDADPLAVEEAARAVHQCSTLKVAWYSGGEQMPADIHQFQYVKLGPYRAQQGPLKSPSTNQRMYRIDNGIPTDITYRFWHNPFDDDALQSVSKNKLADTTALR